MPSRLPVSSSVIYPCNLLSIYTAAMDRSGLSLVFFVTLVRWLSLSLSFESSSGQCRQTTLKTGSRQSLCGWPAAAASSSAAGSWVCRSALVTPPAACLQMLCCTRRSGLAWPRGDMSTECLVPWCDCHQRLPSLPPLAVAGPLQPPA